MEDFDQQVGDLISGTTDGPVAQTSKEVDDPLDAALLDMFPTLPDF